MAPAIIKCFNKITGKFEHKKFIATIEKIKHESKKFKIPCGIHVVEANFNKLKEYDNKGFKFLPYGIDTEIFNKSLSNIFKLKRNK